MNARYVCCCTAQGWSRFIGWVQIVGSLLLVVLFILQIFNVFSDEAQGQEKHHGVIRILLSFQVLNFLSAVMGISLLKGSFNRRPRLILAWLLYTALFLILHVILNSLLISIGGYLPSVLPYFVIIFLLQCFYVYPVWIHWGEVKELVSAQAPSKA